MSEYGIWQSSICETCQTSNLHTEDDCTYIVISTPLQDNSSISRPEYNFIFELRKGETIGIKLDPGVTFVFSGRYLMHRQMLNKNFKGQSNIFFNFASYGNKRLYNHLKSSIKRIYK